MRSNVRTAARKKKRKKIEKPFCSRATFSAHKNAENPSQRLVDEGEAEKAEDTGEAEMRNEQQANSGTLGAQKIIVSYPRLNSAHQGQVGFCLLILPVAKN
jgi:hypothetical protein